MEFTVQSGRLAKASLRMTMLATAVALSACGGGGSSDSVSNAGTTPNTPTVPVSQYHVLLETSKANLNINGDTATITMTVLDNFGGGVADQTLRLVLPDVAKTGLTIDGASSATTDATGKARFTVKLAPNGDVDQQALLQSGILIEGLLIDQNNAQARQVLTLNVVQPGTQASQYQLNLTTDHTPINVKGDTVVVTAVARDSNGGGVANQSITLSLPAGLQGVSIDGASTGSTDDSGQISFKLKVASDLSEAQMTALVNSGIAIAAKLVETSGAQVTSTQLLSASRPKAQYSLSISSDAGAGLNVYGDTVVVSVKASSTGTVSPSGQTIQVALSNPTMGVAFEGATSAQTDASGIAKFTLKVEKGLSEAQITKLLDTTFGIGAVLTENSGAVSQASTTLTTVRPQVQYGIQVTKDKNNLLATGDSMAVVARVLDANGGGVVDQQVTLKLNTPAGVAIDGPSILKTDDKGVAQFSVVLSDKLTAAQRDTLVKSGISYIATLVESSGASVSTSSQSVTVSQSSTSNQSQYTPVISVSKSTINAIKDQWQVTVKAKDNNGGGVADQSITLKLPNIEGLVIEGASTVKTDDKGNAVFTLNNQLLTNVDSLNIQAILTEANGATASTTTQVAVQKPVAQYSPSITLSDNQVGVDGGTVNVMVRALNSTGGSVANQSVTLSLASGVKDAVIDGASTVVTDAQGVATFKVLVKSGAAAQTISMGAVIVETSGVVSPATTASIVVKDVQSDYSLNLSSDQGKINVLGDNVTITAKLTSQVGSSIAGQSIALAWDPKASGLTVNTLTAKTDATGSASFTFSLANLTDAEKTSLLASGLNVSAAFSKNGNTVQSSVLNLQTFVPVAQYQLSLGVDKAKLNVEGDTAVITVQANNIAGGSVSGQPVKLSVEPQMSGVYIQGDSVVQTDNQGQAKFLVSLAGLSATQKQQLIAAGLVLNATLTETNGAQTVYSQTIATYQPSKVSDYQLSLRANKTSLNVYGDQLAVTVLASSANGTAAAGQSVTMSLPAIAGLSLDSASTLTTNASGQATFTFSLASDLSNTERQALINQGIALTATLTESSGATKSTAQTIQAYAPTSSYQLAIASNVSAINTRGDEVSVSVQVLDDQGRYVSDQDVDLILSGPVSLILVNGQSGGTQVSATTNEIGVATYTVTVPANLNASQRQQLISTGIQATARLTEKSGVQTIQTSLLSFVEPSSDSSLTLFANQLSVSPGNVVTITAQAKDADQRILSGRQLNFALSIAAINAGVTVDQITATSDSNGQAQFKVTIPKGIDQAVLNDMVNYAITLAEANGALNTQTGTIGIVQPVRRYAFSLAANKVVQTSGDTFKVFARAVDAAGNPVANQIVRLSVADPIRTGVTIVNGAQVTTDANGFASFDLELTPGANVDQAFLANGIVLGAVLEEDNGITTRQALIVPVDTLNTTGQYLLSWTQSKASFDGFGDEIEVTYRVTDANGGILAGVPVSLRIKDALTVGAVLTTGSTLVTDENGLIKTNVKLTGRELDAVLGDSIVLEASVNAVSYDANGNPTVSQLAQQQITLPKSGSVDINLTADKTALFNGESTVVSIKVTDNAGLPIQNAPVDLINTSDNDKLISTAPVFTDSEGVALFSVAYSNLVFDDTGRAKLAVIVKGKSIQKRSDSTLSIVSASEASFSFVELPQQNSAVNALLPVTVRVRGTNAGELTGTFVINTSLGQLTTSQAVPPSSNQLTFNLDGSSQGTEAGTGQLYRDVTVYLQSSYPGVAVLNGRFTNSQGAETISADTKLRATTPAKLMLQADETTLVPNQSTRIVAIVKDANDSPVSGVVVRFERLIDSSAGRLSAATAVTDDSGLASVTYTAGTTSPVDRVEINATLDSAPNILPQPGALTLTVAQEPTSIVVGSSDKISSSSDNIYYYHPYSVAVIDGSGKPVANQTVSLRLFASSFNKGQFNYTPTSTVVIGGVPVDVPANFSRSAVSCATEDQNRNFTLDAGEDRNNNGQLDIRNPVAIVQNDQAQPVNGLITFKTDSEGKFDFNIRYPKIYAQWATFEMKATTRVYGSEFSSITTHGLPVAAEDISLSDGTRPNLLSPLGVQLDCSSAQ